MNKYEFCSTCKYDDKYDDKSLDICSHCGDGSDSKWERGTYEQILTNESCAICKNYYFREQLQACDRTGCHDRSLFILDNDKLYELFPEMINVNKCTIKGILE